MKKVHFAALFAHTILIFAAITMGYFSATSLIHNASRYLNIVEIFVTFETETKIISLMASAILVVTAVLSYPASVTRDTRWILLYTGVSLAPIMMNLVNIVLLFMAFQDSQEIKGSVWPIRSITLLHDHGVDERLTSMLSKLHHEAQCCGINGWDDFNFNIEWGRAPANIHLTVPESCCVDQSEHALLECQIKGNQAFYHRKGCHEKIRDSIDSIKCDIKIGAAVILGTLALQITALILVLVTWKSQKSHRRDSKTVIVAI